MRKFLILVTLCFGIAASTATTAFSQSSGSILRGVNAIRVAHSLPKLQLHPALQRAAREQAQLMARKRKMSHSVGFGNSFSTRVKRAGYRGPAAENIAVGQRNLTQVLRAWMSSSGHRRNILRPRMRYFGLSAITAGRRKYWAMVLGG